MNKLQFFSVLVLLNMLISNAFAQMKFEFINASGEGSIFMEIKEDNELSFTSEIDEESDRSYVNTDILKAIKTFLSSEKEELINASIDTITQAINDCKILKVPSTYSHTNICKLYTVKEAADTQDAQSGFITVTTSSYRTIAIYPVGVIDDQVVVFEKFIRK